MAAIDISWASRRLERSCSADAQGRKEWGADQWRVLQRRLTVLAAAPTLRDLDGVPGRCHQLTGDRAGQFSMTLWGPYRLIFEPDHNPVPRLTDEGIDVAKITKIVIKEVVDYHGN